MKIHHLKQCPLSKWNTFDQNFMKLSHIVKYHDVFFKFDIGPYQSWGRLHANVIDYNYNYFEIS